MNTLFNTLIATSMLFAVNAANATAYASLEQQPMPEAPAAGSKFASDATCDTRVDTQRSYYSQGFQQFDVVFTTVDLAKLQLRLDVDGMAVYTNVPVEVADVWRSDELGYTIVTAYGKIGEKYCVVDSLKLLNTEDYL